MGISCYSLKSTRQKFIQTRPACRHVQQTPYPVTPSKATSPSGVCPVHSQWTLILRAVAIRVKDIERRNCNSLAPNCTSRLRTSSRLAAQAELMPVHFKASRKGAPKATVLTATLKVLDGLSASIHIVGYLSGNVFIVAVVF
jgi:hypothetical protein